jgi:hypothetical protein
MRVQNTLILSIPGIEYQIQNLIRYVYIIDKQYPVN